MPNRQSAPADLEMRIISRDSKPSQGRRIQLLLTIACAFALLDLAALSTSATTISGATGAHDPSRMILCNGKYYVYATGGGMKFSSDGIQWTAGPSPFPAASAPTSLEPGQRPGRRDLPASLKAIVPENQGIWAPDVLFYRNRYLLYYSACGPHGVNRCGIGLLTSPTLDPSAPDYKWTDAGVVIVTENLVEKKSAIDPGPFVDAKGDLWLVWGSGYANGNGPTDPTIVISKLDNATGLRSTTDTKLYPVAPGHIEAAYVHYRAGFYYAFWNDGGCCNGVNSSYRIHMARSTSPEGPYSNKAGKEGAGDIFMASIKDHQVYGPGHMGIASEPGVDRFSFHYYNAEGHPVLGIRTLVWGADGWPSVGEDLLPGSYTITASNGLVLGVHGGSSAEATRIELQSPTKTDLQKWNVATTPDGYYQLTSVGSGKSLDLAAPSSNTKAAPATIEQAGTGTGSDQQWIIDLASDGKSYRIRSSASQEALASPTTAPSSRKKTITLKTTPWTDLPSQKWLFSTP